MKELLFTVKERAVICRTTREGAAIYGSGGGACFFALFFRFEWGVIPGVAYEELDSRQTDRQRWGRRDSYRVRTRRDSR